LMDCSAALGMPREGQCPHQFPGLCFYPGIKNRVYRFYFLVTAPAENPIS
jgi:hypothetical protein